MEQAHAARQDELPPELRGRPWDDVEVIMWQEDQLLGRRAARSGRAQSPSPSPAGAAAKAASGPAATAAAAAAAAAPARPAVTAPRAAAAAATDALPAPRAPRPGAPRPRQRAPAVPPKRGTGKRFAVEHASDRDDAAHPADPLKTPGVVHGLVLPRDDLDGFLGCDPAHDGSDGVQFRSAEAR